MEFPNAAGLGADGKADLWIMQSEQAPSPTHIAINGERPQIEAFHAAALELRRHRQRPARPAPRLPPELLRGVRPRSRGQQHRGRLPRARGREGGGEEAAQGRRKKSAKLGQEGRRSPRRSRPRRRSRSPPRARRSRAKMATKKADEEVREEARARGDARRDARPDRFSPGTCAGGTMSLRHEADGSARRAGNAKSISALRPGSPPGRSAARSRRAAAPSIATITTSCCAAATSAQPGAADAAALRRRRRRERGARAAPHVRRAVRRAAAHLRDGAPAGGRNRAARRRRGARAPRRPPIWRWARAISIEGCLIAIACSAPAGAARDPGRRADHLDRRRARTHAEIGPLLALRLPAEGGRRRVGRGAA